MQTAVKDYTTHAANNFTVSILSTGEAIDLVTDGELAPIASRLAKISEAETSVIVLNLLGDIYRLMQIGSVHLSLLEDERLACTEEKEVQGCEVSVGLNQTRLLISVSRTLSVPTMAEVRAYAQLAVARLEAIKRRVIAFGYTTGRAASDYEKWCEVEIARLARSPYNLMITGERGTGKTFLAKSIHTKSSRAKSEFVEFNCAALPEHLAEAQLFGYKRGAFTGAFADTAGLFEAATGGTIFLDEVAELTTALQAKLLKVVEERKIRRIGETRERKADVRIIAATARDLNAMIEAGTFRADLYDRLTTLKFETLPLRARRGEIPALVERFLADAAADATTMMGRRQVYTIERGALELLCGGEWAGNIRALRNSVLELTSYIEDERPITAEEVQRQLARVEGRTGAIFAGTTRPEAKQGIMPVAVPLEGDIVLPAEARIIKSGESLNDWIDRWTLAAIVAAQKDAGKEGKWARAGWRLNMSGTALKQRHRLVTRRLERRGNASQLGTALLPYET